MLLAAPAPRLTAGEGAAQWVPLPAFFSRPETGLAGGATVVRFRERQRVDGRAVTDEASAIAFYTERDQFLLGADVRQHFAEGTWRVELDASLREFPRNFYGIGRRAAADEETYTSRRRTLTGTVLRWLGGDWYAGPHWELHRTSVSDDADDGLASAYHLERGLPDSDTFQGLGLAVARDTRDAAFFPRAGSRLDLHAVAYPSVLGVAAAYQYYAADYRHYFAVGDVSALALQVQGERVDGDAPLSRVPRLGGDTMRGFEEGRYVDDLYLSGQLEGRFPIRGRWGGVAFAGVGDVFSGTGDISASTAKLSVGVGLRFAVRRDERLNVRLDLGRGFARNAEDGDRIELTFDIREAF